MERSSDDGHISATHRHVHNYGMQIASALFSLYLTEKYVIFEWVINQNPTGVSSTHTTTKPLNSQSRLVQAAYFSFAKMILIVKALPQYIIFFNCVAQDFQQIYGLLNTKTK